VKFLPWNIEKKSSQVAMNNEIPTREYCCEEQPRGYEECKSHLGIEKKSSSVAGNSAIITWEY